MACTSSSRASSASWRCSRMRAQRGQHDLLDEAAFAVDRALHGAQVLGAQPGARQAGGGGHHAGFELGVTAHAAHLPALDELELLELGEQRGVGRGELLQLFGGELFLAGRVGHEVGLAQTAAGRPGYAGRRPLDLFADDLERQVFVALQREHADEALVVVAREEPVAALGAARRDQALLLEVAQLAHADVGELALEAVDDRPDGHEFLVADVEQDFRLFVHGVMYVSLYLPICSSSPSSSVCRSMRRRLT